MKVLVAVATRHGATLEIGQVIETALRSRGLDAELKRIEDVTSIEPYRAVVLGSAVYAGHWLRPAREFAEAHGSELKRRPVWLFSSGPVGSPPKPLENPAEVAVVARRIDSRGHRLFSGRIEGSDLRLTEKALVALVRAPEGDYRPWTEITSWAESIAEQLHDDAAAGEDPPA